MQSSDGFGQFMGPDPNRQIARSVGLAEGTVKRHLSNAYEKMAVHSRGEAVRRALSEGWVTIQEITQQEEDEQRT
jgi:predicted transcriptional regulator